MAWVARIVDSVENAGATAASAVDWISVEEALGSKLPSDYKKLWSTYGEGRFSGYLNLFPPLSGYGESILSVLHSLRRAEQEVPQARVSNAPYNIYTPGRVGLLPWGGSVQGDDFCWLAGTGDPDSWPIVAREHSDGWERYSMNMSEFLYRVLMDIAFEDFTVADVMPQPYFEPAVF